MAESRKARAVGFNHIALEVGDIDEALAFYGRIFEFKLRGKSEDMAFIDLGDHLAIIYDRRALAFVENALDPAHPVAVPCSLVLPGEGG